MKTEDTAPEDKLELRALHGLTHGLSSTDLVALTTTAIRTHRLLVDKADQFFQGLPKEYRTGEVTGGVAHLRYIEACVEMHAQMTVVNTLVGILGYIPKVSAD